MNVDFPLVVDGQTFQAWHNMILYLIFEFTIYRVCNYYFLCIVSSSDLKSLQSYHDSEFYSHPFFWPDDA